MILEGFKLKDFTELSDDEKLMVLKWRNNDEVKKWMYNSEIISKENHLKFIDNLKSDETNKYFLLSRNSEYTGVIYFNNIDFKQGSAMFGLYANPNISGFGKTMLELCLKYAFDVLGLGVLKLEVFGNNLKAISLYKKFNFTDTNTKVIQGYKVTCMELKNENR